MTTKKGIRRKCVCSFKREPIDPQHKTEDMAQMKKIESACHKANGKWRQKISNGEIFGKCTIPCNRYCTLN